MTLAALHPVLREALGFHEAFRRMGFIPDDIHVSYGKLGEQGRIQVVLLAQCRKFSCDAGVVDFDEESFKDKWQEATRLWNEDAAEDERKVLWDSCYAHRNATGLVSALTVRGFAFDVKNLN